MDERCPHCLKYGIRADVRGLGKLGKFAICWSCTNIWAFDGSQLVRAIEPAAYDPSSHRLVD